MTIKNGARATRAPRGRRARIPSYHIFEPESLEQIDPALYDKELALVCSRNDVDERMIAPMKAIREGGA